MAYKEITGVNSTYQNIVSFINNLNVNLVVFRNLSQDDGIMIKETKASGDIYTRLNLGKSYSINWTGITSLEVCTKTANSNLNVVLSKTGSINGQFTAFCDFIEATKYTCTDNIYRGKKINVYHKSSGNPGIKGFEALCQMDTTGINGNTIARSNIVLPGGYTAYVIAGRGWRVKSHSGLSGGSIYGQVSKPTWSVTGLGNSTTSFSHTIDAYEVPYTSSYSTSNLSQLESNLKGDRFNCNTGFSPYNNAMFLVEPSIWVNGKIRLVNFRTYSGLGAVVTGNNITQSSVSWDNSTYLQDLKQTPSMLVGSATKHYCDLTADVVYTKFLGAAFDINLKSTSYPYSVCFTAPMLVGITFKSSSQIVVHFRDRDATFNVTNTTGHMQRYAITYNTSYIDLYINGVKQTLATQNTTPRTDNVRYVGLNVRDTTINNQNITHPNGDSLYIGNLVLHNVVLDQSGVNYDFNYAKVWRDYYGQTAITSNLITDLNQIQTAINEVAQITSSSNDITSAGVSLDAINQFGNLGYIDLYLTNGDGVMRDNNVYRKHLLKAYNNGYVFNGSPSQGVSDFSSILQIKLYDVSQYCVDNKTPSVQWSFGEIGSYFTNFGDLTNPYWGRPIRYIAVSERMATFYNDSNDNFIGKPTYTSDTYYNLPKFIYMNDYAPNSYGGGIQLNYIGYEGYFNKAGKYRPDFNFSLYEGVVGGDKTSRAISYTLRRNSNTDDQNGKLWINRAFCPYDYSYQYQVKSRTMLKAIRSVYAGEDDNDGFLYEFTNMRGLYTQALESTSGRYLQNFICMSRPCGGSTSPGKRTLEWYDNPTFNNSNNNNFATLGTRTSTNTLSYTTTSSSVLSGYFVGMWTGASLDLDYMVIDFDLSYRSIKYSKFISGSNLKGILDYFDRQSGDYKPKNVYLIRAYSSNQAAVMRKSGVNCNNVEHVGYLQAYAQPSGPGASNGYYYVIAEFWDGISSSGRGYSVQVIRMPYTFEVHKIFEDNLILKEIAEEVWANLPEIPSV